MTKCEEAWQEFNSQLKPDETWHVPFVWNTATAASREAFEQEMIENLKEILRNWGSNNV